MANVVSVTIRGIDQWSGMLNRATKDFAAFRAVAVSAVLALGTAAVAAAAGTAALTQQAINTADATGKAAQKAGVAAEDFSRLAYAGQLAELSQEQLVKAAKAWSIEAAKGQSITGNFTGDLLALSDQFSKSADGAAKVALAVKTFGKSGQDMIPLLNQGSDALREQFAEAEKFGRVIGADFARNADTFNDNLERMKLLFQGIWLQVAERVLPTVIALSESILKLATDGPLVANTVNALTTVVLSLARAAQLGAEAWITFTGLLSGQSFTEIGQDLTNFQSNIDEALARLQELRDTPVGDKAQLGAGDEERLARVQQLTDEFARRWVEFNDQFAQASNKANDEFLAAKIKLTNDELLIEADRNFFIETSRAELGRKLTKIEQDQAKARLQIQAQNLGQVSQMFGNLAAVAQAFGAKGFVAAKAFAVGQAVMNTAQAVTKTLADGGFWAIPLAATVAAMGLAQVATIIAAKPGGQAHSGLTSAQGGTYEIERGERVVRTRQNQDLTRFLRDEQGDSRRPTQIIVQIGERTLFDIMADGSRDGRLQLDGRSVA